MSYITAKIEVMIDLHKLMSGFKSLLKNQESQDLLTELISFLNTGIVSGYDIQDKTWEDFVTKYNLDFDSEKDILHINVKDQTVWVGKGEKDKKAKEETKKKIKRK